jgi:hypothetical protein
MKTKMYLPTLLFIITVAAASSVQAQSLNAIRGFAQEAAIAGRSNRWQAIHWQTSMDVAKSIAYRERKPILVVMHNNFGGDTRSGEC